MDKRLGRGPIDPFSRVCVAILVACFCAGPIGLIQRIAQTWDGFYLVILCGLIAFGASISTSYAFVHGLRGWRRQGLRLAEGVVVTVAVMAVGSIWQLPQFDGLRVAQLLIAALAWWLGGWSTARLQDVARPVPECARPRSVSPLPPLSTASSE